MKHGTVTGLKTNEAFTQNGAVKIGLSRPRNDPVLVGHVSDVTNQPNFYNGVYITENGIEIPVQKYINELFVLTQKETGTLLSKDMKPADDTSEHTPRVQYFSDLLINELHRVPRNKRKPKRG